MQITRIKEEELPFVWERFKKNNLPEQRDQLICHYLTLVKYVVGKLAITLPSHVKIEDMYSTGILGLIKSIERFDIEKNNKFETYAIFLIRGAIFDEMRSLDWVPRSIHQKANKVNKAKSSLQQKLGREPDHEEVAAVLDLPLDKYETLLDRIRPVIMIPLEEKPNEDPDRISLVERLADDKMITSYEDADRNEFQKILEKTVFELPEQEKKVLILYYYKQLMLKEIGEIIGVSESRVSQVHTKALARLKGRLKNFAIEFSNLF